MKYCLDYSRKSTNMIKADEVNIRYSKNNFLNIFDYMKEHPYQRVNIDIFEEDIEECLQEKIIQKIITIQKEHPEYKLILKVPYEKRILDIIQEQENANFFFTTFVRDWETLLFFLDLGVTDVIIVEQMCFELDKVAAIAHKNNVQVRTFCNIVQRKSGTNTPTLQSFFIRPEDVDIYSSYIDVLEFAGDLQNQDLYYNIYNSNLWFGDLKEIIIGFDISLDSRFVVPRFAEKRIRCGRECLKGGNCQICFRIDELSKSLEKAGLMIKIDKDNKTDNKEEIDINDVMKNIFENDKK